MALIDYNLRVMALIDYNLRVMAKVKLKRNAKPTAKSAA